MEVHDTLAERMGGGLRQTVQGEMYVVLPGQWDPSLQPSVMKTLALGRNADV